MSFGQPLTLQAQLAAIAESLIKACGGYKSAALECDVSGTQLQRAADPGHAYSLKASTIFHLEQSCGKPLMSAALYELGRRKACDSQICPIYLGIDLADSATDLTVLVRGAFEDGVITVYEHKTLSRKAGLILDQLGNLTYAFRPKIAEAAE